MINRILLTQLKQWAKEDDRKPLVLRGARQVGKTTLVNDFASEFDVYLKLNLDIPSECRLFEEFEEVHTLVDAIYILNSQQKKDGSTLLFIDEIQNSAKAVAMLRYFYEEFKWLHVITAGSLLESLLDRNISFPVGRVEYMAIHPCSFIEFLNGIGESFDQNLIESLSVVGVHGRIMQHFKNFVVIGGMPAVIKKFAERRDVLACDKIYDSLIAAYSDDVEKYAHNTTMMQIVRFLITEGWRYAGSPISFERFGGTNYRSREVGEAFRLLEKTMLLELVYPTTSTHLPLLASKTRKPKLIWFDTGIVNYVAGVRKEVFSATDIQDVWRGSIAEQIVAQELISLETRVTKHRQYWVRAKDQSSAEIDFIIEYQGRAIPIEVKSGHNAKLKSLHLFMDQAPHDIAVRVWSQPLSVNIVRTQQGKEFRLINVPFYYVCVLEKVLDKIINNK
ncbi:MAG: AAA family ATPase [Paludibacter sp.]|nr:AAA family ATPase [Paludibacter sp.]